MRRRTTIRGIFQVQMAERILFEVETTPVAMEANLWLLPAV